MRGPFRGPTLAPRARRAPRRPSAPAPPRADRTPPRRTRPWAPPSPRREARAAGSPFRCRGSRRPERGARGGTRSVSRAPADRCSRRDGLRYPRERREIELLRPGRGIDARVSERRVGVVHTEPAERGTHRLPPLGERLVDDAPEHGLVDVDRRAAEPPEPNGPG